MSQLLLSNVMTITRKIEKDVFLSYASPDENDAARIHEAIVAAGGSAFFSKRDITPGANFAERIREELQSARELWLLVTPNSLNRGWVLTEWGAAWALGMKIVPILLRVAPEQLPELLRSLQCVDYHEFQNLVMNTFPAGTSDDSPLAEDRRLIDDRLAVGNIIQALSIGQRHLFAGRYKESLELFEYTRDRADKSHYDYYIILGNIAYSLIHLGRNRDALYYLSRVRTYHDGETFFPWHAFAAAAAHLREGEIEECKQMIAFAKRHPKYEEEVGKAKLNYPDLIPYIDDGN
jgi:tetratricopeptide (TPR) repeat protein